MIFYLGQDGEDSTLIESLYISVLLNVLSFITSTNGIIGIMMRNSFQTLMINFITREQYTKRKLYKHGKCGQELSFCGTVND